MYFCVYVLTYLEEDDGDSASRCTSVSEWSEDDSTAEDMEKINLDGLEEEPVDEQAGEQVEPVTETEDEVN